MSQRHEQKNHKAVLKRAVLARMVVPTNLRTNVMKMHSEKVVRDVDVLRPFARD